MRYLAKILVTLAFLLSATSCTIYTEKRSEALSQAVFATSDSIALARFDLADQYSKQAERLAFPPKQRIKLSSVYTTDTPNKLIPSLKVLVEIEDKLKKEDELITSVVDAPSDPVLRLVVPEHLKHAQLLIENSEEWNELIRTKDFSTKLKEDYANLQTLSVNVNKELQKQNQMNSKLITDLNELQKKILKKDLAILRRNIVISVLIAAIGGGIYLRIKGIL